MNQRSVTRAGVEGLLLGAVGAAALGMIDVWANHDLAHGMPWLAATRTLSAVPVGGLCGALASTCLWLFFDGLRTRRLRTLLPGLVGAVALGATLYGMVSAHLASRLATIDQPATYQFLVGVAFVGALSGLVVLRASEWLSRRSRPVPPNGRSVWGAWVGALGLVVVAAAPEIASLLQRTRAAPWPPVVLISIDTMRADRLGMIRAGRSLTPHLDAVAAEGATFLNATATAPWTQPSHASIFASLLPFDQRGKWGRNRVPPRLSMLAERLVNAGYRTAAFTGGGSVDGKFGFDQGFERYESHDELDEGGPDGILSRALRWVSRVRGQPFFLFLHTYEVHIPYRHADFADRGHAGRIGDTFEFDDLAAVRAGTLLPTAEERRHVVDLYDGDVAFADRVIGGFLERLDELVPLDDVILVVLSDHGEDLWDHVPTRSADHGHSLYEEILRVPLVVRAPGRVRAGLRIETPVSLLDVAPTLLSLAGLEPDEQHRGRDLSETLRRGGEPDPRPIYAESVHYGPDRFSVREGDLKVICSPHPNGAHSGVRLPVDVVEIFDLGADPRETTNLYPVLEWPPDALETLWERAVRFARSPSETGSTPGSDMPPRLRRQLRALGYLG